MAAKFFTGLPLNGPDPECVKGFGEAALAAVGTASAPKPTGDHSRRTGVKKTGSRPVPVTIGWGPQARPVSLCEDDPLAGFTSNMVK